MKDGGIMLIIVGVFVLLLVTLAYIQTTYSMAAFWAGFAVSLIVIGIILMVISNDRED